MTAYDNIRLHTGIAEQEHNQTVQDLADRTDELEQANDTIVQRDAQIVSLEQDVDALEATVQSQHAQITQLQADLAECEGTDPPDPPTGGFSPILVPAGNKIFVGCSVPSSGWSSWVSSAGGKVPHIWHEYADTPSQLQSDINNCPQGCIPLLNFKPAGGMGLSAYNGIVAGQYNSQLDQAATIIKTYGKKMFLAFMHEPENDGTAADDPEYVAAYRYCVTRFRQQGVTNAVYVWNMMGIPEHGTRYTGLYPGDDVVDWIGMDPYITTSTTVDTWNELLNRTVSGWSTGFYNWAKPKNKPIMLCEWGIGSGVAGNAAPKMMGTDMPNLLTNHPLVRGMVYWNQAGERADYRVVAPGWPSSQVASYVNRPETQIDVSSVAK